MNILHATTDPDFLDRLKQMLSSSSRADIAAGYFFISGFEAVADDLDRLDKVRILVGRPDRRVLEEVAAGLQQAEALLVIPLPVCSRASPLTPTSCSRYWSKWK